MATNLAERADLPVIQLDSADGLLSKALEKGVSIDIMERLLAMRQQIKADQAREAFYAAMSNFQSDCPVIKKERVVKGKDGKERYRYASIDDIASVVSPLLSRHNLSYKIEAEHKQGFIIATCIVSHAMGHSERSFFEVPIEKDAFMNDAQKSGSALAYAKRYAFCNALGIITGEGDDDAASLGSGVSIQDIYKRFCYTMQAVLQNHDAIMLIKDCIAKEQYKVGAETWFQLNDDIKRSIWVATTKGGPFTSKEREVMKSNEWHRAYYGTAPTNIPSLEDDDSP